MDGLLVIGAAGSVWEALSLPADLAVVLLAARHRRVTRERAAAAAPAGRDDEDGKWRRNPDGSVSVQIRSMESLTAALSRPPGE